jgi:hypothetical protein
MTTSPSPSVDSSALPAPHGVIATLGADRGWHVDVSWEYTYRFEEIECFEVHRRQREDDTWELIKSGIPNVTRSCTDILPGEGGYAYTVTAVTRTGDRITSTPACNPRTGQFHISPDPATTQPTGIRKPLPSTTEAVFIAWDPHPHASAYRLEAMNSEGKAYATVDVPHPGMPVGLIRGPHPEERFIAKVTVLRCDAKGHLRKASSATQAVTVDNVSLPHLAVVDFTAEESDVAATRSLGMILALAEGSRPQPVTVNGTPYPDAWQEEGGHWAAAVQCLAPLDGGVVVAMATETTVRKIR